MAELAAIIGDSVWDFKRIHYQERSRIPGLEKVNMHCFAEVPQCIDVDVEARITLMTKVRVSFQVALM
jgi:hypothetical protein